MVKKQAFIRDREAIPEFAKITGINPIQLDYEFGKSEILGVVCVFDIELTAEQAQEIDRKARVRSERTREMPAVRPVPPKGVR